MTQFITLAVDVDADPDRVFEILTRTDGQRTFWTEDCDVSRERARFGFPSTPSQLAVGVTTEPSKLVRMKVTSGFPFWEGSTWEWGLGDAARAETGSGVLFRHYGFGEGYADTDLGHTVQTWAGILDRLAKCAAPGAPQPCIPAPAQVMTSSAHQSPGGTGHGD
jgi:uncharacterized protein YndB with AHSA1/START domain